MSGDTDTEVCLLGCGSELEMTHIPSKGVLEWWHGSTLAGRTSDEGRHSLDEEREDGRGAAGAKSYQPSLSLIISHTLEIKK